ncbi:hypothetical protein [Emticicia sp. C21]|uniref:hypothetical protein n=1 Tax=Emticicia sp. C21 TaxID=2302915 RepID=UPI000E34C180|nr:hypothetical protein [Emticicia sp. C21]
MDNNSYVFLEGMKVLITQTESKKVTNMEGTFLNENGDGSPLKDKTFEVKITTKAGIDQINKLIDRQFEIYLEKCGI